MSGGCPLADKVGLEVIDAVRELLPVLRDRAQEAEDGRVVPADSIKALEGNGVLPAIAAVRVRRP